MGVIRYKIWSDVWKNKTRTLQVVMIIAMGAFAVGMIIGSSDLIREGLTKVWLASSPASINIAVDPAVDDATLQSLRSLLGVAEVEGNMTANIEWRHNTSEPWQPARLVARDDYRDQTYATLSLVSGDWPERRTFGVLQGVDTAFDISQGSQIQIRVEDKASLVDIGGILYNPLGFPPSFGGNAEFYTTRQRFAELTGQAGFNEIFAGIPHYEREQAIDAANRIERRLEKLDVEAFNLPFPERVSSPEKHAFQDVMDGLFVILAVMAVLTLVLGLLLVYNTITAILTQQIDQIGIMKAIGASFWQILGVYLLMVLAYSFLSMLIAIPLGALGAYGLTSFMLSAFNVVAGPFRLSLTAVLAQIAICLLAPLIISLVPLFSGARVTVREAISTYGLSVRVGRLSSWLASLQRLSRLIILMISNTFRNKGRVILTQLTLVGSGLIFMMVMSTWDSVKFTFNEMLFDMLRYNVTFQFKEPERIEEVEKLTLAQPEVKAVEMWGLGQATIRPLGQPESNNDEAAIIFGVPLPTQLYAPRLTAGRWLEPGEGHTVVLNQTLAGKSGLGVGDQLALDQNLYGQSTWTVVGLLLDPVIPNSMYVSREMLLRETHSVGEAETIWIQTVRHDQAGEVAAALDLRRLYNERKLDVNSLGIFPKDTATELAAQIMQNFGVIISLLAIIAVIMGFVGAITLSGVLSLSVLERTREIGVMRAIGATSRIIATLFIGEGLTLGWLSWLIAWPLSIPASYLMTQVLGQVIQNDIVYTYTPFGALYWLGIVTVLAVVASWLPARGATRISVNESLAYQ